MGKSESYFLTNNGSPNNNDVVKPRWLDGFIRQSKFGRTQDRASPPTLSFERTTIDARGRRIGNEEKARPRTTTDVRARSLEDSILKSLRGKRLDSKDVD